MQQVQNNFLMNKSNREKIIRIIYQCITKNNPNKVFSEEYIRNIIDNQEEIEKHNYYKVAKAPNDKLNDIYNKEILDFNKKEFHKAPNANVDSIVGLDPLVALKKIKHPITNKVGRIKVALMEENDSEKNQQIIKDLYDPNELSKLYGSLFKDMINFNYLDLDVTDFDSIKDAILNNPKECTLGFACQSFIEDLPKNVLNPVLVKQLKKVTGIYESVGAINSMAEFYANPFSMFVFDSNITNELLDNNLLNEISAAVLQEFPNEINETSFKFGLSNANSTKLVFTNELEKQKKIFEFIKNQGIKDSKQLFLNYKFVNVNGETIDASEIDGDLENNFANIRLQELSEEEKNALNDAMDNIYVLPSITKANVNRKNFLKDFYNEIKLATYTDPLTNMEVSVLSEDDKKLFDESQCNDVIVQKKVKNYEDYVFTQSPELIIERNSKVIENYIKDNGFNPEIDFPSELALILPYDANDQVEFVKKICTKDGLKETINKCFKDLINSNLNYYFGKDKFSIREAVMPSILYNAQIIKAVNENSDLDILTNEQKEHIKEITPILDLIDIRKEHSDYVYNHAYIISPTGFSLSKDMPKEAKDKFFEVLNRNIDKYSDSISLNKDEIKQGFDSMTNSLLDEKDKKIAKFREGFKFGLYSNQLLKLENVKTLKEEQEIDGIDTKDKLYDFIQENVRKLNDDTITNGKEKLYIEHVSNYIISRASWGITRKMLAKCEDFHEVITKTNNILTSLGANLDATILNGYKSIIPDVLKGTDINYFSLIRNKRPEEIKQIHDDLISNFTKDQQDIFKDKLVNYYPAQISMALKGIKTIESFNKFKEITYSEINDDELPEVNSYKPLHLIGTTLDTKKCEKEIKDLLANPSNDKQTIDMLNDCDEILKEAYNASKTYFSNLAENMGKECNHENLESLKEEANKGEIISKDKLFEYEHTLNLKAEVNEAERLEYAKKIYNESNKISYSKEEKEGILKVCKILESEGIIDKNNLVVEGAFKEYSFLKLSNYKLKLEEAVKTKDILKIKRAYTSYTNLYSKYQQAIDTIKEFSNDNSFTSNISSSRMPYIPYEFRRNYVEASKLTNIWMTYNLLSKLNISMEDYLDNPIKVAEVIVKKAYGNENTVNQYIKNASISKLVNELIIGENTNENNNYTDLYKEKAKYSAIDISFDRCITGLISIIDDVNRRNELRNKLDIFYNVYNKKAVDNSANTLYYLNKGNTLEALERLLLVEKEDRDFRYLQSTEPYMDFNEFGKLNNPFNKEEYINSEKFNSVSVLNRTVDLFLSLSTINKNSKDNYSIRNAILNTLDVVKRFERTEAMNRIILAIENNEPSSITNEDLEAISRITTAPKIIATENINDVDNNLSKNLLARLNITEDELINDYDNTYNKIVDKVYKGDNPVNKYFKETPMSKLVNELFNNSSMLLEGEPTGLAMAMSENHAIINAFNKCINAININNGNEENKFEKLKNDLYNLNKDFNDYIPKNSNVSYSLKNQINISDKIQKLLIASDEDRNIKFLHASDEYKDINDPDKNIAKFNEKNYIDSGRTTCPGILKRTAELFKSLSTINKDLADKTSIINGINEVVDTLERHPRTETMEHIIEAIRNNKPKKISRTDMLNLDFESNFQKSTKNGIGKDNLFDTIKQISILKKEYDNRNFFAKIFYSSLKREKRIIASMKEKVITAGVHADDLDNALRAFERGNAQAIEASINTAKNNFGKPKNIGGNNVKANNKIIIEESNSDVLDNDIKTDKVIKLEIKEEKVTTSIINNDDIVLNEDKEIIVEGQEKSN